ncbi:MAG: hypothetical protein FJY81_03225, partial [Candidatus Aminicenantes bacterium]|nr:hypothetical protein [Candidatus Aminicenantes bacterium]
MKKGLFMAGLVSLFFLSGCVIVVDRPYEKDPLVPRASFKRTLDMKPGETISLENARGDIEVEGWDEDKVEITAEEKGERFPKRRFYVSSWKQSDLKVDVESSPDGTRVRTDPDIQKDELRAVHYVLRVPRSVHLRSIRNGRGDIRIADLYGTIAVDAEEGNITIENFSGS